MLQSYHVTIFLAFNTYNQSKISQSKLLQIVITSFLMAKKKKFKHKLSLYLER